MTTFKKTPKQKEATKLLAAVKYALLFGGSRSGKTFLAVRSIVVRAAKVKSRHLIARFRFNSVKTSIGMDTLPKVMALCFPDLPYKLNKTDWFVELPNGSQIWLAGTDDKERTEKVLGTEFSTIYFNESSQFVDYDTITTLLTRLAENAGLTNRAWFDCNPPSKKHWTYQIFVKGLMPVTKEPVPNFERDYGYILMNPADNMQNLPADYIETLQSMPKRQRQRFLEGKFLLDVEGALWNQQMIDAALAKDEPWNLRRTVIGVDPATTNEENSDEWGIGAASEYNNKDYSVDADYTLKASPATAVQVVINAYEKHDADAVVVETNQGGKMIEELLRNAGFTGRIINVHASKSKFSRAEPIAALYEQGQVKHRQGLDELESEQMEYVPLTSKKSPNRLDWLVWALTELSKGNLQAGGF
jgi:PBSX family phage terminase large subunit